MKAWSKKSGTSRPGCSPGGKLGLEEIANYAGLVLDEVKAIAANVAKG